MNLKDLFGNSVIYLLAVTPVASISVFLLFVLLSWHRQDTLNLLSARVLPLDKTCLKSKDHRSVVCRNTTTQLIFLIKRVLMVQFLEAMTRTSALPEVTRTHLQKCEKRQRFNLPSVSSALRLMAV